MIEILIVDDHPIFRNGLKQIIAEESDMLVKNEAVNGKQALKLLTEETYDAVVLDIEMKEMNGLEVLKQMRSTHPDLPVLIMSFYPEEQYAIRSLKLGASGYLTKESAAEELVRALKKIISGKKYITPTLAEHLAGYVNSDTDKKPHERLSEREYQVFCQMAEGKSASEISEGLHLSPKTVSTYRTRIFEKTGLKNDAQVIRYAIDEGLVR